MHSTTHLTAHPLESRRWTPARYATLAGVLVAHGLLILAVFILRPPASPPGPPGERIELVYLPPAVYPAVKAENSPKERLRAALPAPPALFSIDPPPQAESTPDRPSQGSGTGVDWAAEARRAVQAFDIRNDRRTVEAGPTGRPGSDEGWRYAWHRPGEQSKTRDGDWIVWIDANCYQLAGARPGDGVSGPWGRVYCIDKISGRISSTK